MKSLDATRPWPPEMCDELRQHLGRYGWSQRPETVVDDDLFALLGELEGWLEDVRQYSKRMTRGYEWKSIVEDVKVVFGLVGSNLEALLTSADALLVELDADLGVDYVRRKALVPLLEQVVGELKGPAAAGAAFLDVVDAVKDPATRTEVIEGRIDIFDSVLRFEGRSLKSVALSLCSILDNHAWTINALLTELDDVKMVEPDDHNADPGLTAEERIALRTR